MKRKSILIILTGLVLWILYLCDAEMSRYGIYTIFSYNIHEIISIIPLLSIIITIIWLVSLVSIMLKSKNIKANILLTILLLVLSIGQMMYISNRSQTVISSFVTNIDKINAEKMEIIIETDKGNLTLYCPMIVLGALKTDDTEYYITYERNKKNPSYGKLCIVQSIDTIDLGADENDIEDLKKYQEIILPGDAGPIGIQIPEGWESISFPSSGDHESYYIRFSPRNVENGYIELAYMNSFGVCGTGLKEKEIRIAGDTASMGTYDNQNYWAFIAYEGKNKGLVAKAYNVTEWCDGYESQVLEILNTASMNKEQLSKTEVMYYDDTKQDQIGLSFNVANVNRTNADLYFIQQDGNPKGDLQYGEYFIIEKFENGAWMEAPIITEDNYAFNEEAYPITKEGYNDFKIDWEWLYGELVPGGYRIGKRVIDFIETGSYDEYMIYVHFIIN